MFAGFSAKLTCRFSIKREYALRVNFIILNHTTRRISLFSTEIVSKPLNLLLCKLLVVFQWTLSEHKEVPLPSSIKVIKCLAIDSCRNLSKALQQELCHFSDEYKRTKMSTNETLRLASENGVLKWVVTKG
jgi:hypothetical protein